MNIESGELSIIRQEFEEERFVFRTDSYEVVFVPHHFDLDDGGWTHYMNMTRSVFNVPPGDLGIVQRVHAEYERLMTLYFEICKFDRYNYPFPKHEIANLLELNLTDDEVRIVRRRLDEFTCIYFIRDRDTGLTKIGQSEDPERRLSQLVKQSTLLPRPHNFMILKTWEDYTYIEKALHDHFAEKRVRGEWFDLTDQDIEEGLRLTGYFSSGPLT